MWYDLKYFSEIFVIHLRLCIWFDKMEISNFLISLMYIESKTICLLSHYFQIVHFSLKHSCFRYWNWNFKTLEILKGQSWTQCVSVKVFSKKQRISFRSTMSTTVYQNSCLPKCQKILMKSVCVKCALSNIPKQFLSTYASYFRAFCSKIQDLLQ